MASKKMIFRMFILFIAVLLVSSTASARPLADAMGTSFTYQGRLTDGGLPATGTYDLEFKLYDALTDGVLVGTDPLEDVPVSGGLFTVQLDFGNVFDGRVLYLQIGVRPGTSTGGYTPLTPRQPLTPAPYSLYALQSGNADLLDGQHSGSFLTTSSLLNASNISSGTLGNGFFDAYSNLGAAGYLGDAIGDLARNNSTLQATLNADLLDGKHASDFVTSSHNHWGQTWTGAAGSTETGLTLSGGETGINVTGYNYGVYATGAEGVLGIGSVAGVWGSSNGDSSYGVSGYASGTNSMGVHGTGPTGVFGGSNLSGGYGVWGAAYGGSNNNYAGYFDGNVQINGSLGITSTTLVTNLNADLLDSKHAGNASGNIPVSNGTVNTNLNSDMLEGYHAGTASGNIPISNGTLNANLNAELLNSHNGIFYQNAGNINAGTLGTGYYSAYTDLGAEGKLGDLAGSLALNDGTLQPTLNADLLDGQHGVYYRDAGNINAGTLGNGYFSAYSDLGAEGYLGNAASDLALNDGTLQPTLNADLLDSKHASDFVLASNANSHSHGGASWTGGGTVLTLTGGTIGLDSYGTNYGVYATSSATDSKAIYGATNGSGGIGVEGVGPAYGVVGSSTTNSGSGIYGEALNGPDSNFAGFFEGNVQVDGKLSAYGWETGLSGSGGTWGVTGIGTGTGTSYGVYGIGTTIGVKGSGGFGVYGLGNGSNTTGVYGLGDGNNTTGVRGYGSTGVVGQSNISGGKAIYGLAKDGSGDYAGYFDGNVQINGSLGLTSTTLVTNLNADLLDGYHAGTTSGSIPVSNGFVNTNLSADMLDGNHANSFSLTGHNHWGQAWTGTGTGLTLSGGSTGLSASGSSYGLNATSTANSSYGVYSTASGTNSTAVYGTSAGSGGTGLYGSGTSYGVHGSGFYGVFGEGTAASIYGLATTSSASAIWGQATGSSTSAGLFDGNVRINGNQTVTGRAFFGGTTDQGGLINTSTGAYLTNGGTWTNSSDRNLKANFTPVRKDDILSAIASLPISTWNYKSQDASIRHIGPMAQDFYAAFNVGEDDTHIATVDSEGVALAGIQALTRQNRQLEDRIASLEKGAGGPSRGMPGSPWLYATLVLGGILVGQFLPRRSRKPNGEQA